MRHRAIIVAAASALAAALLAPALARAAEGDLDPGFGTAGKVTTPIGSGDDEANSLAIDATGRIVAAGYTSGANHDFALARYNQNGTLDNTFGSGGKVTTPIGSSIDVAESIAIDAAGRIVAAGWTYNGSNDDFALARYNPNGTLDSTFGTAGKVTTPFGSGIGSGDDEANSVAIDTAGRIIAAGSSGSYPNYDFALARYNPNGTLDSSFGSGGKVTTPIGSSNDAANSVAIDTAGRIVVAGYTDNGTIENFALARYNPRGALDSTFGSGGKVTTPIGSTDVANSVAIDAAGRIVAAGTATIGSNADFALARYNQNGTLDSTFGSAGEVVTPIGSSDDEAASIAIDAAGRLVAAGPADNGSNADFALARYNQNGTLDSTFGTAGKVTTPIGSSTDVANSVAIDAAGRIVAAGYTYNGSNDDFALARYIGDQTPPAVTIDSGPAEGSYTNETRPSFAFSSNEAGSSFNCGFDGPSAPCTSPLTPASALADGPHAFTLTATDKAGNTSAPITRNFTVDTAAPTLSVDSGPAEGSYTNDPKPTFEFSANEAGASFECTLDGSADPCASPFTPASTLSEGPHTFSLTATDKAGNTSAPITRDFTVDTVRPSLTIKGKGKVKTRKKKARVTLKIVTSEPSDLTCKVDRRKPKSCGPKFKTPKLKLGKHKVKVTATDQAGNASQKTKKLKVVRKR